MNNRDGLLKTKKSIENQTFMDLEWLVQDGASTDDTLEILNKAPSHGLSVQSTPDNGIYDAMNRAIDRATGTYLLFLNAGDTLATPKTLETIHSLASDTMPAFLYGDACENSHYKKARPHTKIAYGMFTHHQSMLYHRETIASLRYNTDYQIAADYDFTARFLLNRHPRGEGLPRSNSGNPENTRQSNCLYIPMPISIFEQGGISQQQTRLGRIEQYNIRKNLNLCSAITNQAIKTAQASNLIFRRVAPALYWQLKQR